jgi:hypothetical protein
MAVGLARLQTGVNQKNRLYQIIVPTPLVDLHPVVWQDPHPASLRSATLPLRGRDKAARMHRQDKPRRGGCERVVKPDSSPLAPSLPRRGRVAA